MTHPPIPATNPNTRPPKSAALPKLHLSGHLLTFRLNPFFPYHTEFVSHPKDHFKGIFFGGKFYGEKLIIFPEGERAGG